MKASMSTILVAMVLATAAQGQESDRAEAENSTRKRSRPRPKGAGMKPPRLSKKPKVLPPKSVGRKRGSLAPKKNWPASSARSASFVVPGNSRKPNNWPAGWRPLNPTGRTDQRAGHEVPGPARLRHLRQAIEHLHAAGMHDMAENLEKHAQRIREDIEAHGRPGTGAPAT